MVEEDEEEEEIQSLEELRDNLAEYVTQRSAVAELLEQDPENEEYREMASGLDEVIALTEE
eukprot:CAMPEP_0198216672 /NCGR_PEP_ID=MMETSP1445-20131203/58973_1 /TAXON_ID=36898 /ORGANISM="Pyramimonas sp., Strain CCMP2087" /LENGTH=60 /DNA_ID=CAMNT_0043893005 /DNA_START=272 /DNA_END=451 /DNA_ORIENTATION=+